MLSALGYPIAGVVGLALLSASLVALFGPDTAIWIRLIAIPYMLFSLVWCKAVWVSGRYWYAMFTDYVVLKDGVDVTNSSKRSFFPWSDLRSAIYRRAFGQLELEFEGAKRKVILTNVDRNWERRSLMAVRRTIEEKSAVPIRSALL